MGKEDVVGIPGWCSGLAPVDGHLGSFHSLATVDIAAKTIGSYGSFIRKKSKVL